MKKGKVLKVFLLAFCCAVSFVSCSNEVSESVGDSTISFTTSVSKALNQSGLADESLTENVEDYYWKYYCDTVAPSRGTDGKYDNLEWKQFDELSSTDGKGLGKILKLIKGESYYFGLRGYKDADFEDLVWEGFHFETGKEGATSTSYESIKLTSKVQLVTIDVYSAGVGKLYLNIYAPATSGFDDTNTNNQDANGNVKYDRFHYELRKLDADTTADPVYTTNLDINFSINDGETTDKYAYYKYVSKDYGEFWYSDIAGSGTELTSGAYFMTIWEEAWDKENSVYKEVSQRRQVLIVNIVPGVNTVINGSLDSTTLDVLDFDGADAIEVIFHPTDASVVKPMDVVSVKYNGTSEDVYYTTPSNIVRVSDGDFITIDTPYDNNLRLYVNGIELKRTEDSSETNPTYVTTDTNFLVRTKNNKDEATLVKRDSQNSSAIIAYAKADYAYILTIRRWTSAEEEESVSFTIKTATPVVATDVVEFSSSSPFKISDTDKGWNGKIYWTDGDARGDGWQEWDGKEIAALQPSVGDEKYSLYFRGEGNTKLSGIDASTFDVSSNGWKITAEGDVTVTGQLVDLLDYTKNVASMDAGAFAGLFENCTKLVSASGLEFPSFTSDGCYKSMFSGCTSLSGAPALPATTLSKYCYYEMFANTALSNTPALAATKMEEKCYYGMFSGCTKLVDMSELPQVAAADLAADCYASMFSGCSGLYITIDSATASGTYFHAPAENAATYCLNMFKGASGAYNGADEQGTAGNGVVIYRLAK